MSKPITREEFALLIDNYPDFRRGVQQVISDLAERLGPMMKELVEMQDFVERETRKRPPPWAVDPARSHRPRNLR